MTWTAAATAAPTKYDMAMKDVAEMRTMLQVEQVGLQMVVGDLSNVGTTDAASDLNDYCMLFDYHEVAQKGEDAEQKGTQAAEDRRDAHAHAAMRTRR